MKQSSLTNAKQFTRSLEEAYRDIWQKWCVQAMTTIIS